jgi:hypothetical protein
MVDIQVETCSLIKKTFKEERIFLKVVQLVFHIRRLNPRHSLISDVRQDATI